jgi:hypothetical protein
MKTGLFKKLGFWFLFHFIVKLLVDYFADNFTDESFLLKSILFKIIVSFAFAIFMIILFSIWNKQESEIDFKKQI